MAAAEAEAPAPSPAAVAAVQPPAEAAPPAATPPASDPAVVQALGPELSQEQVKAVVHRMVALPQAVLPQVLNEFRATFDEYFQAPVITLQAFMYLNTARNSVKTYHYVTFKEPKSPNQLSVAFSRQQQTPPSSCYQQEAPENDEVSF